MRITERQLRRIIRESVRSVGLLHETKPPLDRNAAYYLYGHSTNRDSDNEVTSVMKARKLQRAKDFWEKNIKKSTRVWPSEVTSLEIALDRLEKDNLSFGFYFPGNETKDFDKYDATFDNFMRTILPTSPTAGLQGLEKRYQAAKKRLGKKDYWMNDNPNAANLLDQAYEFAKTIYPPNRENIDFDDLYEDFKEAFDKINQKAPQSSGWNRQPKSLGPEIFERAWKHLMSRYIWGDIIKKMPDADEFFKALVQRMIAETDFDEYEEDEVFGKYAFAPERRTYRSKNVKLTPYEENTPIEQTAFEQLKNHKEGKWGLISPEVLKVLIDIQNQNLYTDVFPGIADIPVYRGMGVNQSFIENLTGKKAEDIYQEWLAQRVAKHGEEKILTSPWEVLYRAETPELSYSIESNQIIDLKPGRTADAWTTSFKVANYFSSKTSKGSHGYQFSIILQCNMLDNKNVMINLNEFDEMLSKHPENEVLAIGPVKINKIYLTYARKKGDP
jgi:hypothetical protein